MQTKQKHIQKHKQPHFSKKVVEKITRERLSRIDREFADGFDVINQYDRTVTVFGSARFTEDNEHYQKAHKFGARLADEGYAVVTGGGGGIMEAGNRGAFENGGDALGFNISLPHEQVLNPYTTQDKSFHYFFARKVILAYDAKAYAYFPGGYGTLDELFEIITLIQTNKIPRVPVVLFGTEFWEPLHEFIKNMLRDKEEVITPGDEQLYIITDSVEEAIEAIKAHPEPAVEGEPEAVFAAA